MISSLAILAATSLSFQKSGELTIQPKGAVEARLGYMPVPIELSPKKPIQVKREPAYRATPKYGTITVGNGPKSVFVFAVDEPADADYKIYIDRNRDGDLTNDGDGAWNKKTEGSRAMYGVMDVTLRSSYGTKSRESSSSDYTLGLYRFVRGEPNPLLCYRESSRNGMVEIDGKNYKALLVENDADGVFNKKAADAEGASKTRPIWLRIDSIDEGKPVQVDARAPFMIGEKAYEATISVDGARISIKPTTKAVPELTPKRAPTKPLLKVGTPAPDFVSEKWEGGELKLSDYRGQVVILDFWATWCGPCMAAMPHIESIHKSVKDQGVTVLGLCVFDEKDAYSKWVPANKEKYTFQFAFDPGARDQAKSIAASKYNVSGIPTTYVIDKEGNVAAVIVGYDKDDKSLEESLKKLGVKVD